MNYFITKVLIFELSTKRKTGARKLYNGTVNECYYKLCLSIVNLYDFDTFRKEAQNPENLYFQYIRLHKGIADKVHAIHLSSDARKNMIDFLEREKKSLEFFSVFSARWPHAAIESW